MDDRMTGRPHRYGYSAAIEAVRQATFPPSGDFAAKPLARIHLPDRIPLGFHGSWIADV